MCVFIGRINARGRPVGTTKDAYAPLIHFGVQCINPFGNRNIGVVAVQAVNIQIIRLQPVKGLFKLTRHGIRRAVWGMGALAENDHIFTHPAGLDPRPQRLFAHATAVNMRGVEACAALLKKRIGHRCHGRRIYLVVRAQYQPRHWLVQPV